VIHFKGFDFGSFKKGDQRFAIEFDEVTVWNPHWKDLLAALKYALIVEQNNRRWFNHGSPRKLIVNEVITILNDRGYDVRENRKSTNGDRSTDLFEFFIETKIGDDLIISHSDFVKGGNFSKAKHVILERAREEARQSVRDGAFRDRPMEITRVTSQQYRKVRDWQEEYVDPEEAAF